ncbi:MAG: hypothetical protein IPP41_15380 [Rhodocyclaceae bacterium]|nr:hypothetical protein [Rhodocyclaceae bacterium]
MGGEPQWCESRRQEFKINLSLPDINESYVLWIENSVLHFRQAPAASDANASLAMTRDFSQDDFIRPQAYRKC